LIKKSISSIPNLMKKSSILLAKLLTELSARAVRMGLTQSAWADRAGIREETLSRLHRRNSCDLATLHALAQAVAADVAVVDAGLTESTDDGRFPRTYDRDFEERLVALVASRDLEPRRWLATGPSFFMAGLAVMLASLDEFDRSALLTLGERLHAGISQVGVFSVWLRDSPLRPSRFIPLLMTHCPAGRSGHCLS
jgi:hypothetical protein